MPSCTARDDTTPVSHCETQEIIASTGVENRPLDCNTALETGSFSDHNPLGKSTRSTGTPVCPPVVDNHPKIPQKGQNNVHSGTGALQDSLEAKPPSIATFQCRIKAKPLHEAAPLVSSPTHFLGNDPSHIKESHLTFAVSMDLEILSQDAHANEPSTVKKSYLLASSL